MTAVKTYSPDPNLIRSLWGTESNPWRPHLATHRTKRIRHALVPDTTGLPQRSCAHASIGQSQVCGSDLFQQNQTAFLIGLESAEVGDQVYAFSTEE